VSSAEEMGNPKMRSMEAAPSVAARCIRDGGEHGNGDTRGLGGTRMRSEWMKWVTTQSGKREEGSWRRCAWRMGTEGDIDAGDVDSVAAHREQAEVGVVGELAEANDVVKWLRAHPPWPPPSPRCPAHHT
jgi:hypothetical protein